MPLKYLSSHIHLNSWLRPLLLLLLLGNSESRKADGGRAGGVRSLGARLQEHCDRIPDLHIKEDDMVWPGHQGSPSGCVDSLLLQHQPAREQERHHLGDRSSLKKKKNSSTY